MFFQTRSSYFIFLPCVACAKCFIYTPDDFKKSRARLLRKISYIFEYCPLIWGNPFGVAHCLWSLFSQCERISSSLSLSPSWSPNFYIIFVCVCVLFSASLRYKPNGLALIFGSMNNTCEYMSNAKELFIHWTFFLLIASVIFVIWFLLNFYSQTWPWNCWKRRKRKKKL